jgi:hypothetical protein
MFPGAAAPGPAHVARALAGIDAVRMIGALVVARGAAGSGGAQPCTAEGGADGSSGGGPSAPLLSRPAKRQRAGGCDPCGDH